MSFAARLREVLHYVDCVQFLPLDLGSAFVSFLPQDTEEVFVSKCADVPPVGVRLGIVAPKRTSTAPTSLLGLFGAIPLVLERSDEGGKEVWVNVRKRVLKATLSTPGTLTDLTREAFELRVEFLNLVPVPGLAPAASFFVVVALRNWLSILPPHDIYLSTIQCRPPHSGVWFLGHGCGWFRMDRLASLSLAERCVNIPLSVRLEAKETGDANEESTRPLKGLKNCWLGWQFGDALGTFRPVCVSSLLQLGSIRLLSETSFGGVGPRARDPKDRPPFAIIVQELKALRTITGLNECGRGASPRLSSLQEFAEEEYFPLHASPGMRPRLLPSLGDSDGHWGGEFACVAGS
ncbi:hypothetical protein BDQ17DRAFT_1451565 [Cyathus striatus]|nr:hypothetical protein BDQ17DRAFT_1451565 [Cyathus striatus]